MVQRWSTAASPRFIRAGIGGERGFSPLHSGVLNLRIIAKAAQPANLRLAAKPGHLPLSIVAVRLLGGLKRLLTREFPAKKLHRLLVAQRRQRSGGVAVFLKQCLRLFDEPSLEHQFRAAVDSVVERLPIGVKAEAPNAEAAQRFAPVLLPELRHLLARSQANLNGTDDLGRIVGMNSFCRRAIQAAQDAM